MLKSHKTTIILGVNCTLEFDDSSEEKKIFKIFMDIYVVVVYLSLDEKETQCVEIT